MAEVPVSLQPRRGAKTTSEVTVRLMTSEDAAFVARWLVYGFQHKIINNLGKHRMEPMVEALTTTFSSQSPEFYKSVHIAEYQGQPAGFAKLRMKDESFNLWAFWQNLGFLGMLGLLRFLIWIPAYREGELLLDELVVKDGFRGKGIGAALLTAVDDHARQQNLKTVFLWCAYGNRAKNLYERHGYEEAEFYDGYCRTWFANGVRKWHRMAKKV